jgi:S-adenosylmethionine:tRNA ribosyltransferase-isomerase
VIPQLNIKDFDYNLPEDSIAFFPVDERDQSKLLIFNGKKFIKQDKFSNISHYLPGQSLLVFNNTRVIHARFIFENPTGSKIEVFCLKPVDPLAYENALKSTDKCSWECMIGNLRKWKDTPLKHSIIKGKKVSQLTATRLTRTDNGFVVRFSWDDKTMTFGEIMDKVGLIPLPPYIKRQPVRLDNERYQTVYASHEGSVAAPTAGLHFTDAVFKEFTGKKLRQVDITLHVGAGTFLPVKSDLITDHAMHAEQFSVSRKTLKILLDHSGPIIAIGTTTVRTLESLFWLGMKSKKVPSGEELFLDQWEPYEPWGTITVRESLENLLTLLIQNNLTELTATTRIMIVPGYKFRLVDQLVTNFHQPRSTLLLLVAAFIGEGWKEVYAYALANDFRFLSYGDSSLLIPEPGE